MMPGGGVWGVGPGQVTDDSELAICLARALRHHHPKPGVPLPREAVAVSYAEWLRSPPFDIGACSSGGRGVALLSWRC